MIHAATDFSDDPDAQDLPDATKRTRFLVCPICGGPMADDSTMCRRCAPGQRLHTPRRMAKVQRQRFMDLVRELDGAPELECIRILETVVWPG